MKTVFMSSHLINVRLDLERLRKVRALRERGVRLSDVVRKAIDEQFLRLPPEPQRDAKAMMRKIFELYPDPSGLPSRGYDVHDRVAARRAIIRKLRPGR
jgi:hypothetical protein